VIWYYTFGVNCTKKFNRSHAHLFHFVKDPDNYTFNEDEICVPSARQLVYADSRAHPAGRLPDDTWIKLPDDTWILRPQDVPNGFAANQATWYFPRVAGTFKERMGFHGCQMPEQLLGRIIRTCSNPGDVVLDPFAGSGTTLTVAKKLGRMWIGFELSQEYTQQATKRIKKAFEGQPLEGAPEPVVSAPRTPGKTSKVWLRSGVHRAILEAFFTASDGWSSDRVIVDPNLNERFCEECHDLGLLGMPADWNRALMRLRKAGKLQGLPKARKTIFPEKQLDKYLFASEIAMRQLRDQTALSLDDILCDPELARKFDEMAQLFAPGFLPLQYRWAALTIRKRAHERREQSRTLPSAMERQEFSNFRSLRRLDIKRWGRCPGVYLAQVDSHRKLYIGETFDLGKRLQKHLDVGGWPGIADDSEIGVLKLNENQVKNRCSLQSFFIGRYFPELNYRELGGL
jgi:site-specific DNA-methyltransferase (adenine-specific)